MIAEIRTYAPTALKSARTYTQTRVGLAQRQRVVAGGLLGTEALAIDDRAGHRELQRAVSQRGPGVSGGLVARDDGGAVDLAGSVTAERSTVLVDSLVPADAVQIAGVGGELLHVDRERGLGVSGADFQVPDGHVGGRVAGSHHREAHDRVGRRVELAGAAQLELPDLSANLGVGQNRTELDLHQVLTAVRVVNEQSRDILVERERGLGSRGGRGGRRLGRAGRGRRRGRHRDGVRLGCRDRGGGRIGRTSSVATGGQKRNQRGTRRSVSNKVQANRHGCLSSA